MRKIFLFIILTGILFTSCGRSTEEQQRITKAERQRLHREDSLALKIAVMPTLDCLPLYLAKEKHYFDTLGVDVRLKRFNAQMDCDTALAGESVEGSVTDLIRALRLQQKGMSLNFITSTNAYWILVANHKARLKKIDQLGDKMIAMTRYSATDFLSDKALYGVKTSAQVFKIQVNDVNIRLSMLLNNEMDALWLTEPQATIAMVEGHRKLYDSRDSGTSLGVIAFNRGKTSDSRRQQQMKAFITAYNRACDSISNQGLLHYTDILSKYYGLTAKQIQSLPHIKFSHTTTPRTVDITKAKEWLEIDKVTIKK